MELRSLDSQLLDRRNERITRFMPMMWIWRKHLKPTLFSYTETVTSRRKLVKFLEKSAQFYTFYWNMTENYKEKTVD